MLNVVAKYLFLLKIFLFLPSIATYPIQFSVINCHIKDFLSDLVQRCIESGFMYHFEEKTNRLLRPRTLKESLQMPTSPMKFIQLEDFTFVLVLYLFGILLSILIFFTEIFFFKQCKKIYSIFVSFCLIV